MTGEDNPARDRPLPRCQRCDYVLLGAPADVCPECGESFNLRDPATFHARQPLGPVGRLLIASAGWKSMIVVLLTCLVLSWVFKYPSFVYLFFGFCAALFVVTPLMVGLWIKALLVGSAIRGRRRVFGHVLKREQWAAFTGVAVLLGFCFLANMGACTMLWTWPFLGHFDELADEVKSTMPTAARMDQVVRPANSITRQIGPWNVRAEHYSPGVVILYTGGSGNFAGSGTGFIRLDPGTPLPSHNCGTHYNLTDQWIAFGTD